MSFAYVDCIGCEQRLLDAERVRIYLLANGYVITEKLDEAHLAILVTCAVDQRREQESIKLLEEIFCNKSENCQLIVGGCLPSISPSALNPFAVIKTFSPRSLESLDGHLNEVRKSMSDIPDPHQTKSDHIGENLRLPRNLREEYDYAKRGFKIRINHGCLLSCSYCVIKKATGELKSVPELEIVSAFEVALDRKESTVMLMGGDTGAYGLDTGTDFADILQHLLQYDGNHQIFIHDFNINWLLRDMPKFEKLLQGQCGHLRAACIPVQSGSNAVLKRMRRPYKAEDAISALRWVRQNAPHVGLGTHIIVGFPGETDADFDESLRLLHSVDFDFVTCFSYSEHPSALSSTFTRKISEEIKQSRINRLRNFLGNKATFF